ncbi:hypothetical protein DFH08DRAFT_828271 [Mycena albidolilacea]|uniref:Uncharacterized protein n=1 Tax=Mycena albidolilacea TaxID=1033008 RepID=A0AAD7E7B2_9AGAR|nr:hypothetical protein DFH08DRAFT_828271 [Mycena albidolilacea]
MQRAFVLILLGINIVRARLQNITVDNTSPDHCGHRTPSPDFQGIPRKAHFQNEFFNTEVHEFHGPDIASATEPNFFRIDNGLKELRFGKMRGTRWPARGGDATTVDIIYGGQIFQCNADTCPDNLTERLSNNSISITNGTIRFSFAGTAFYASLAIVGHVEATMNGDTQNLNINVLDVIPGGGYFEIWQSNMPNASHILSIVPESDGTLIGLDHLVYITLVLNKKSHVGAIVGGVIGGVVLILGVLFVAMFAQRRKLILRRNRCKSVVLCGINSARYGQGAQANYGANLSVSG